jgi:hypothetical protein
MCHWMCLWIQDGNSGEYPIDRCMSYHASQEILERGGIVPAIENGLVPHCAAVKITDDDQN